MAGSRQIISRDWQISVCENNKAPKASIFSQMIDESATGTDRLGPGYYYAWSQCKQKIDKGGLHPWIQMTPVEATDRKVVYVAWGETLTLWIDQH